MSFQLSEGAASLSPSDLVKVLEHRLPGPAVLDSHFLRSPDSQTVFLFVDKVACTYVKQTLYSEMLGDLHRLNPEYFWSGLDHLGLLHVFTEQLLAVDGREVLADPTKNIITFCRNPYDRFLSAYYNKIQTDRAVEAHHRQWLRREIVLKLLRAGKCPGGLDEFAAGVTSAHFAEFVRLTPPWERDIHWTEQHRVNLVDLIRPTALIRFEAFQEEFLTAWDRYVGYRPQIWENFERNRSGKPRGLISEQIAEIVFEVYRKDFELFGYEADSWRTY